MHVSSLCSVSGSKSYNEDNIELFFLENKQINSVPCFRVRRDKDSSKLIDSPISINSDSQDDNNLKTGISALPSTD